MKRTNPILLVEDNEDDIFIMERVLVKAGIANPLRIARDGEAAIVYLSGEAEYADREKYPLPFLIFLDLKLPYLSGFEVLKWIRSRPELNNILVVVLTSSGEQRDHETAYSLGARSYLVKPPTSRMLVDLMHSFESFWSKLGETEIIWSRPSPPGGAA